MSNEEVRELCHILTSLNYDGQHTLLNNDSFSRPNFNLICDILEWFARILQSDYRASKLGFLSTSSEADKISQLINLGKLFNAELGIQLELIELFEGDNSSCRELLKIARPIYKAALLAVKEKLNCDDESISKLTLDRQTTMKQVLEEINDEDKGKRLYEEISELARDLDNLLCYEEKLNEDRVKIMDRRLELTEIVETLKNAHNGIVKKTKELADGNASLRKDFSRLDERLEGKEMELQAARERLNDLLIQSPAYFEQYERMHKEYEQLYESYVSKYRNLTYLKWCVYFNPSSDKTTTFYGDEVQRRANPVGSIGSSMPARLPPSVPVPLESITGGARELLGLLETTGPARLDESELESEGASKPRSASLIVDELGRGAGVGAGVGTGLVRAGAAGGTADIGRRTVNAGLAGLELEGLLNEFVADSEATGAAYEAPAAAEDDDDELEADEDEDEDEDGLTSDDEEEEDEGEILGGGAY